MPAAPERVVGEATASRLVPAALPRMGMLRTCGSISGRRMSISSRPLFNSAPAISSPSASRKLRWNCRAAMPRCRKTRSASAGEIARALDVTPADVRHHLGVLVSDGLVTVTGDRREGRGRPVKLYGLSSALTGDNLAGLLDAALREWLDSLNETERANAKVGS